MLHRSSRSIDLHIVVGDVSERQSRVFNNTNLEVMVISWLVRHSGVLLSNIGAEKERHQEEDRDTDDVVR